MMYEEAAKLARNDEGGLGDEEEDLDTAKEEEYGTGSLEEEEPEGM